MSYSEVQKNLEKSKECIEAGHYVRAMTYMETAQSHWSEELNVPWPDFSEEEAERAKLVFGVYCVLVSMYIKIGNIKDGYVWTARAWHFWDHWSDRIDILPPNLLADDKIEAKRLIRGLLEAAEKYIYEDEIQAGTEKMFEYRTARKEWQIFVDMESLQVSPEIRPKVAQRIISDRTEAGVCISRNDLTSASAFFRSSLALHEVWGDELDIEKPELPSEDRDCLLAQIISISDKAWSYVSVNDVSNYKKCMNEFIRLLDEWGQVPEVTQILLKFDGKLKKIRKYLEDEHQDVVNDTRELECDGDI